MADVELTTSVASSLGRKMSVPQNSSKPVESMTIDTLESTEQAYLTEEGNNMRSKTDLSPSRSTFPEGTLPDHRSSLMSKKKPLQRRIIAEDPEWNLALVEPLSSLALKSIVKNFEKNPILASFPEKYRDKIISSVSIDLPLSIASKLIPDESYWQRRAMANYKLCSIDDHNNSWKQLFFEKYTQNLIESFVPKTPVDEPALEALLNDLKIAADYVEKLRIGQLRPTEPAELNPATTVLSDAFIAKEQPNELIIKPTDPAPNHLDVSHIFNILYKLKSITFFYGVKDCGINFNWSYFGMTLTDCQKLSDSLKGNSTLEYLSVQSSGIDDDQCRILAAALSQNMVLSYLSNIVLEKISIANERDDKDLAYNNIGDLGAQALAKVIASPTTSLSHLILSNNRVGKEGAVSLAKALTMNISMKSLDLRLNALGDEGCTAICLQSCKAPNLESLMLSGNSIGPGAISSICILLRRNLKKLAAIDMSCNRLGATNLSSTQRLGEDNLVTHDCDNDFAGKAFFEAISRNKV